MRISYNKKRTKDESGHQPKTSHSSSLVHLCQVACSGKQRLPMLMEQVAVLQALIKQSSQQPGSKRKRTLGKTTYRRHFKITMLTASRS